MTTLASPNFLRTLSPRRWPWWVTIPVLLAIVVAALYAWMPPVGRGVVLQDLLEGLVIGSIYVLGASGLTLTYGIKKFANFAHGDMMTVGAYVAYAATVLNGASLILGFVYAMFTVAVMGICLELSVFHWLEKRSEIAALIASVGVSLILQNIVQLLFLSSVRNMNFQIPQDVALGATGLSISWFKASIIGIAVALMVFLHLLLKYTTLGKAMRACADDIDLARASGINPFNVILWTWALSGALAGIAGVLLGLDVYVSPYVGFYILLFIFAAVIVGGIGSPYGAMIGGFLIGIVQELSGTFFGQLTNMGLLQNGASYDAAGAFLVLILVLLLKPEGIMGRRRPSEGRRRHRRLTARRASKEVIGPAD
jgi:branched-chain amino acid transport system permease protein